MGQVPTVFCGRFFLPGKDIWWKIYGKLNEYLRKNGDGKTVISIVLELTGTNIEEGSVTSGKAGAGNG